MRFGWKSPRGPVSARRRLRQHATRTVVARERTRPLAAGEPRGWLGRLGEVAREGLVRVRDGLLRINGGLWAVDRGQGL